MTREKKKTRRLDPSGWLFWLVCFAVLVVPCNLLARRIQYEDTDLYASVMVSTAVAAISAGFVAWAVNMVVQRREKKRRQVARKKTRKQ